MVHATHALKRTMKAAWYDARSRIEDADFSVETTNLAKAQILSQASTAMLPFVLKKFGQDPASASAPFVAVITFAPATFNSS